MKRGRGRKDHVDKSRRMVSVMCHGREYARLDSGTRRVYFYESLVGGGLHSSGLSSVVFGLSDIHTYTRTMYTIYIYIVTYEYEYEFSLLQDT
jgi:hypothetical protein